MPRAKNSWNAFELALVMSHLACADEPEHAKNEVQRKAFDALRAKLPKAAASLANSAGILLGRAYHYDLVRPGIALYGGKASHAAANRFAAVVQLSGRILQVRDVAARRDRRLRRDAHAETPLARRHPRGGICRRRLPLAVGRGWPGGFAGSFRVASGAAASAACRWI